MKKRSLLSLILVLAMIISGLTACGSKAPSTGDTTGNTTGETTNDGTGATDAGEEDKVVNIAISENILTMDPLDWSALPSLSANLMTYDSLIESDHLGNYTPQLATEWGVGEDGITWTFKLREGVKFSNGEDFNADDVVATYNRLLTETSLAVATTYWPVLKSVEKVDDYTVNIILTEPFGPFEYSVSNTFIIPDQEFANRGVQMFAEQDCIGTGPWVLEEWVDGQFTHFVKNENYWGDFKSYYDEVYFRHMLEPSSAIASHLSGDIDGYISAGGISTDMLPLYAGSEDKIEQVSIESGTFQYLGFQCKEGSPFANKEIRKAFSLAIDRQSIISNILGGGKVPSGIIVDTGMGFDSNLAPYEYNVEEAKKVLEASGYNGEPIVLSSNTNTLKAEEILLAVSDMVNSIGFNTTVEVVEGATLKDMRSTGDYDAFMVTNMHPGGDPYSHLTMRILNDAHHSNYVNEELSNLVAASNAETDQAKRAEIIKQANQMMVDEFGPHINLTQLTTVQAVNYGVSGLLLYTDGYFNYRYVTFDSSAVK